jgi:hypothetical protein
MTQINPAHYSKYKIEPWDFIYENNLGFAEGNIIKYVCRWREKNGIEDLNKAATYIQMLIDKAKTEEYSEGERSSETLEITIDH